MTARILLVIPDVRARETLSILLRGLPAVESVFSASDGRSALDLLRNSHFNVLIIDCDLIDGDITAFVSSVSDEYPHIKILALAGDSHNNSMLRAFNAGAVGYLTEERFKPEIGAALPSILDGKIYISPGITQGASPEAFLQKLRRTNFSQQFTVREHEILECMRKRMSNREIAEKLNISITTVKSHKETIMDKLGIRKSVKIAQYLDKNELFW